MIDGSGERLRITMERILMHPPRIETFVVALPPERYHRLIDLITTQTDERFHGDKCAHLHHTRSLVAFVSPYVTEREDLLECV